MRRNPIRDVADSPTNTPERACAPQPESTPRLGRRRLIGVAAALGVCAVAPAPVLALAGRRSVLEQVRALKFTSIHTGENLDVAYWENGGYLPDAMEAIAWQLRDHRTGDVHEIDPVLLDWLVALQRRMGFSDAYHVISGYRSPRTNRALAARGKGVAKNSLHMRGKAIDVRIYDRPLTDFRNAAIAMGVGGVGYYSRSNFVHLDIGRPRTW